LMSCFAQKGQRLILENAIEKAFIFDDAEVPLYPTLLKMIPKRDWAASYM